MADATLSQNSFLGGELSLSAQGRFDLQTYRTSMNVCTNSMPIETGAWTRRPGFKYGNHTKGGLPGRAITWTFQEDAPYTMEFTNGYLRFHDGPTLATTNDAQAVVGISSANPAVVHTTTAHGWSTNDTVKFSVLGTPDPILLNRQFVITVTDSTHFSIAGATTGTPVDGSTLQAFTTGTVTRVLEIITPYNDTMWPTLRSVQAEKQSILLQKSVIPQVLTATPPSGSNNATFTIAPAQFVDGPYGDPVKGATLTPASVTGIVGFTMASPAWSASVPYSTGDYVTKASICYKSLIDQNLNNDPATATFAWVVVNQNVVFGPDGLQSHDIGRHIRLFSEPLAWAASTTYSAGQSIKYNLQYWTSLLSANTGNIPGNDATHWEINANAARWTWGKITSLTGATATIISPTVGASEFTPNTSGTADNGTVGFAFDGITNQSISAGWRYTALGGSTLTFGVGKNYTGTPQKISYVVVTAPNDRGFITWITTPGSVTLNLRGKATAPTLQSDGTLLGSATFVPDSAGWQQQIFSNDTATTWNYLWLEIIAVPVGGLASQGPSAFGIAEIQFYTTTAFSGTGFSVQIFGPDLLYTSAISIWRQGMLRPDSDYPKCGTYHEGRLWLSGLVSNRLDASALTDISGNPATSLFFFTPTIQDGTVSDDCAISYTLDGPDVNAVFWLEPDHQGILVGTQAGEWLVSASALNSPLTPVNMQAHRVTKIGCANIEPRRTDHTLVLVQKDKRKIMEYFADIFSGKFSAPNLTKNAAHLSGRGIEELAYQNGTTPYIWARCTDGTFIGCTYSRDSLMQSQGPTFAAWHDHSLGSGRLVESIAVGPAAASASITAGSIDTLAIISNDPNTNIRHLKFMTPLFTETDTEHDAWYLDDAIEPVVQQSITSGGKLGVELDGLWALNGSTVTAFLAGVDCGDFLVSNGKVNVPYGAVPLFTQALATSINPMPAVVGFTYNSDGQIVRPAMAQESGARTGPALGKKRRAEQFAAQVISTQKISFGTSFATGRLKFANFLTPGMTPYAENALFTGIHWDSLQDDYGYDSMLCWRVSRPYPATIAAISLFLQTMDK